MGNRWHQMHHPSHRIGLTKTRTITQLMKVSIKRNTKVLKSWNDNGTRVYEIKPPCTACAKAGLFLCRKTWMEGVRANTPTHEYVWAIKATTFDHVWSSEIGYVHLNWKRKHMFAMQIAKSEYTTNSNNTRRSREREENITRWYIFTGVWSQQTSRNIKQPNTWGMRQFKQPIWYAKGLLPNGIDEHSTTLEVRVWMKTKGNAKAEMRWAMTHVGTIARWKLAYDQLSNRVLLVRYEQTKLWLLSYDRAWTNMHRISSC